MSGSEMAGAGFLVFFSIIGIALFIGLMAILPSKSSNYRKFLANMYVASRIRQLADEDKLNLDEENNRFLTHERRVRIQDKDLDKTIEEDLKDRVGQPYEKSKDKNSKK